MTIFCIVVLVIICIVGPILYYHNKRIREFKSSLKYWEIGDTLYLKTTSNLYKTAIESHPLNISAGVLTGWDTENITIKLYSGLEYLVKHNTIDSNNSAKQRESLKKIDDYLKKENKKKDINIEKVIEENKKMYSSYTNKSFQEGDDIDFSIEYNGKPIAAMNETELQVALKTSIAEEKYEITKIIKHRLNTEFG